MIQKHCRKMQYWTHLPIGTVYVDHDLFRQ